MMFPTDDTKVKMQAELKAMPEEEFYRLFQTGSYKCISQENYFQRYGIKIEY